MGKLPDGYKAQGSGEGCGAILNQALQARGLRLHVQWWSTDHRGQSLHWLYIPPGAPHNFYFNIHDCTPDYLFSRIHHGARKARTLPVRRQAVLAC